MTAAAKVVAERFIWEKVAMAPRAVLRVAKKVSRLLDEQQIPHALAGGLAVGFHGFNRMTRDADFVIPKNARKAVENLGPTSPVSGHLSGLSVKVDGVDVDFLFVGKTVRQADLSSVAQYAGLPVIGVDPLVAMKMGAGRSKDTLDVIELLKLGTVSVEVVSARLSGDDLEQFHSLVTIAGLEKRQPKKARRILTTMLARSSPSK